MFNIKVYITIEYIRIKYAHKLNFHQIEIDVKLKSMDINKNQILSVLFNMFH